MRLLCVLRLTAIAFLASISTAPLFACKCASNYHGKNAWETAKLEAAGSTVIFEGIPVRSEFQWDVLNAKLGDAISGNSGPKLNLSAKMLITFRVIAGYKGNLGPEIQIRTGLGGGDCGAVYSPGLTYLVFANGTKPDDLDVGMCSPGGWTGSNNVSTDLRYLRKEQPIPSDLALRKPWNHWNSKEYSASEAKIQRDSEESRKRYAAATGKICGTVISEKQNDGNTGLLSFLSTTGYSPVQHPTAGIQLDGSFCSGPLGPGKYYLYFIKGSMSGITSAVYYPEANERADAKTIEVRAGQTQSGVVFHVPVQKTYSVRGVISVNDKSSLHAHDVYVNLVDLDGLGFPATYSHPIDFESSFPLPKTKYFNFENVLPGRYLVYVVVSGQELFTKKQEVTVTTHMKFISLELQHEK